MAYVYGKLKEALLGGNGDKVGKDFSPNMVKSLFIGRDNIVVIYHTRSSRVVKMDINQVTIELGSGASRRESLNNVLNKYKLGCLEEIYADAAYRSIAGGYLDLKKYVDELSRTRLRYYGWYNGDATKIIPYMDENRVNHGYTLCAANSRACRQNLPMEVCEVTGKSVPWYKVHDVRPADYQIDASLAKFFATVDAQIEKEATERMERDTLVLKTAAVKALYKEDYEQFIDTKISANYTILSVICDDFGDFGKELRKKWFEAPCGKGLTIYIKDIKKYYSGPDVKDDEIEATLKRLGKEGCNVASLESISVEELTKRGESGDNLFCLKSLMKAKWNYFVDHLDRTGYFRLLCSLGELDYDVSDTSKDHLKSLFDTRIYEPDWSWVNSIISILFAFLGLGRDEGWHYIKARREN